VVLSPIMQQVPLCAFAILLVYTGFKLASPAVFKQIFSHGIEQLLFFVATMVLTLYTNLLIGLFGGLILALFMHWLLARVSIFRYFKMIFYPGSNLVMKPDGSYDLKIRGIANFLGILKLNKLIAQIPSGADATIDLSETRLVGTTVLENIYDFQTIHRNSGGNLTIKGLDDHVSSTNDKLATKIKLDFIEPLNRRQNILKEMAESYAWDFQEDPVENLDYYKSFYFFKSRPIEAESNCISDHDKVMPMKLIDVTFEEGAGIIPDEYRTTIGLLKIPFKIPKFTIEKKDFLDRVLPILEHKNIDYMVYDKGPKNFNIKVEDEQAMDAFMTEKLKVLIEISGLHHFESNGEAILIFSNNFAQAQVKDYFKMIQFVENAKSMIKEENMRRNSTEVSN